MSWMRKLAPLAIRRDRSHDPEFHKVKTQLSNVATALEACVHGLEALQRDYDRLYSGVRKFANDFYSLYPSNDEVRRLGESTVNSADALLQDVQTRMNAPENGTIHIIDRQIKAYLQEIRNLQKEFKNVANQRADFEAERDRYDRYERRGMDEDKRAILREQMNAKKTLYEATLRGLTHRLGSTYNKHAQVFQAAWTAYVLRLDEGKSLLDKHLRSHRSYAKRLEKDVLRMQLGTLENFSLEN
ncbi:hypothetical protein BWQ96_06920 [Gracilariopsis chorda]|uniref:BAR domain-containing protein n=1 Tax=Gracilariopsis chorda TaxID=448386 RepID=A0A2V3IMS4_9FLOR|nr:hypothetical protein BWQ96_06920 [Gracilariopsis chorda]|eukprot:PXF43357.1 hypothetical protein BWQ96_06920 [Gracilariopsis chorda]